MAAGMAAQAGVLKNPLMVDYTPVEYTSPDGRYAACSMYGSVVVYDLTTGDFKEFDPEDDVTYYDLGSKGYAISRDNILVGQTTMDNAALLFTDTWEWKELMTNGSGGAFAISDDSSIVAGYVPNPAQQTSDDYTRSVPAIWERNSRGNYGNPEILPYPETDVTGRAPQYVLATCISEDGNMIGGQMKDCRGYIIEPIYWVKDADGKWNYVRFASDFINPYGVEFPKWDPSANDIVFPDPADYMNADQRAAYLEAMAKYEAGEGDQPYADLYMTDAQFEAFSIAQQKAFDELAEKTADWYAAYDRLLGEAPIVEQNQVWLNGHNYVTDVTEPSAGGVAVNVIANYDIAKKSWTEISNVEGLSATLLANDGTILAFALDEYGNNQGYAVEPGKSMAISLSEWLGKIKPEYVDWVLENMTVDVVSYDEVYNPDTDEYESVVSTIEDYLVTGKPDGHPNLNLLACYADVTWDDPDQSKAFVSYLLPLDLNYAGIEGVATDTAATLGMQAYKGGRVTLAAPATMIQVVDLQGRVMFEQANPASEINTGLTDGIFIIKATGANGTESVMKAVF